MVEDWAESIGFEGLVILTGDYKVTVKSVLETDHYVSCEFGGSGIGRFDLLQVEWPFVVDEQRLFFFELVFCEGNFVVCEPCCDCVLSMVGVCGLSGEERRLGIASCNLFVLWMER